MILLLKAEPFKSLLKFTGKAKKKNHVIKIGG